MKQTYTFQIGDEFTPSLKLKTLSFIYLFIGIFITFLFLALPMLLFSEMMVFVVVNVPFFIVFLILFYWIPLYYKSISYQLKENELICKRGVWFKSTGVVPYSKITNLDVMQGPISRKLGIGLLKIQTAGYSSQNATSEIKINGMEQFEELRDVIMEKIAQKRNPTPSQSIQTSEETSILNELVKIRTLLENSKKG
jgi:membrane protein YdbS with pleckstrin-like domain